jgi:GT2 family glycosyltransferase
MSALLSIVIVNWNTKDDLQQCLVSIPAGCAGISHDIFVVDNSSADGSPEMVRSYFPEVTVIESGENLGFSKGNNIAFSKCSGKYVLLLNPDTICKPKSLTTLVNYLEESGNPICGPMLLDYTNKPSLSYGTEPRLSYHLIDPARTWHTMARVPKYGQPKAVEYIVGACLMIRRDVLEEVGYLDEQFFMYFEESDWCKRARDIGYKIYLVTGSEVIHLEGRSASKASRFALAQFYKSYHLFLKKHRSPLTVLAFRTAIFMEYLIKGKVRFLVSLFKPEQRQLATDYFYIALLQLRKISVTPPA